MPVCVTHFSPGEYIYGWYYRTKQTPVRCEDCWGAGRLRRTRGKGSVVKCRNCYGRGKTWEYKEALTSTLRRGALIKSVHVTGDYREGCEVHYTIYQGMKTHNLPSIPGKWATQSKEEHRAMGIHLRKQEAKKEK